jgi:hypothetical protein
MDDELELDDWLAYFRNLVSLHNAERDFLRKLHLSTHARFEQLVNGPREILLDNARELFRESAQYLQAMDTKLRLCRMEAKIYKQKNPEDTRYKELADLCKQLHIISTQVMPFYYGEEEFLKTVLTSEEFEGLRRDVINDFLLAGKKARGEV